MTIFEVQPAGIPDSVESGGYKMPYPFSFAADGLILNQKFWKGVNFKVIGFQKRLNVYQIDLLLEDFVGDPQQAVGMWLVTADDRGRFSTHTTAIESASKVRETS